MTIEQKALELVRAHGGCYGPALEAAIEAHELDKSRHAAEMREQAERFSEAAYRAKDMIDTYYRKGAVEFLSPFILAPVDPLYEALKAVVELGRYDTAEQTQLLRGELDARGLAIVKKEAVNG